MRTKLFIIARVQIFKYSGLFSHRPSPENTMNKDVCLKIGAIDTTSATATSYILYIYYTYIPGMHIFSRSWMGRVVGGREGSDVVSAQSQDWSSSRFDGVGSSNASIKPSVFGHISHQVPSNHSKCQEPGSSKQMFSCVLLLLLLLDESNNKVVCSSHSVYIRIITICMCGVQQLLSSSSSLQVCSPRHPGVMP